MIIKNKTPYVLVISWGGTKGLYACWILKAIEETWFQEQIGAVYGVSAGALTGAYWLSWWKAEDILERFLESNLFSLRNIALPPKDSLLKSSVVAKFLKSDLKSRFEDLEKPLYVGATDLWSAEFVLYQSWELWKPVLWSMSIPGVFAAVEYDGRMLVDGGVLCNFPIAQAREEYPDAEIIGIQLGKFEKNQKVKSLIDNVLLSYQVMSAGHLIPNLDQVSCLFDKSLEIGILENSESKIREFFEQGYQDGIEVFSKM